MRCVVNENFKVFHGHSPVKLEAGQVVTGSLAELLLRSASGKVTELPDGEPADGGQEQDPPPPPGSSPAGPPPPTPAVPGAELDIDAKADDVLAWVGEDPERAAEALAKEQAKDKPRSTLVKQLAKIADPDA